MRDLKGAATGRWTRCWTKSSQGPRRVPHLLRQSDRQRRNTSAVMSAFAVTLDTVAPNTVDRFGSVRDDKFGFAEFGCASSEPGAGSSFACKLDGPGAATGSRRGARHRRATPVWRMGPTRSRCAPTMRRATPTPPRRPGRSPSTRVSRRNRRRPRPRQRSRPSLCLRRSRLERLRPLWQRSTPMRQSRLTGSKLQKLGATVRVSVSCPSEPCRATASGARRTSDTRGGHTGQALQARRGHGRHHQGRDGVDETTALIFGPCGDQACAAEESPDHRGSQDHGRRRGGQHQDPHAEGQTQALNEMSAERAPCASQAWRSAPSSRWQASRSRRGRHEGLRRRVRVRDARLPSSQRGPAGRPTRWTRPRISQSGHRRARTVGSPASSVPLAARRNARVCRAFAAEDSSARLFRTRRDTPPSGM